MSIKSKRIISYIIKRCVDLLMDFILAAVTWAIFCFILEIHFSWRIPLCSMLLFNACSVIFRNNVRR